MPESSEYLIVEKLVHQLCQPDTFFIHQFIHEKRNDQNEYEGRNECDRKCSAVFHAPVQHNDYGSQPAKPLHVFYPFHKSPACQFKQASSTHLYAREYAALQALEEDPRKFSFSSIHISPGRLVPASRLP